METPANTVTLLISTISILGGAIVFLALYIRKIYNTTMKRADEDKKELLGVVRENTKAISKMESSINTNTVATTNAAEQTSRSMDRLSDTIGILNRDFLTRRGE